MSALLEVKNLKKYFPTKSGMLHAVDGINFTLDAGKTLGVVGESGCGKTTLMDNQQGPTVQFNTLRQTVMKKNMKRYTCCTVTLLYRKKINTTLQINYTLTFFKKKPGPRKIKYLNLRSSSE